LAVRHSPRKTDKRSPYWAGREEEGRDGTDRVQVLRKKKEDSRIVPFTGNGGAKCHRLD